MSQPPGYPVPVVGLPRPVAVHDVPGTPFSLAVVGVAPTPSGPAIGSLAAGVASILVALVVACFGLLGARGGWGALVGGAFAVLAACAGLAAIGLAVGARRQVRRSAGTVRGQGLAVAGLVCGAVGLGLTALAILLAIAVTAGS